MKKRIGRWLKRQERRYPFLRRGIRTLFRLYLTARFRIETLHEKTDRRKVVFASYEGKSYSDNPRALFEYMVRCGQFADYTFIWGFRGQIDARQRRLNRLTNQLLASGEITACPEVIAVKYDSRLWRRSLAQAGCWVINYEPPEDMLPGKDQILLQTWHGTPLKRLGFDLEHLDDNFHTVSSIRSRYAREVRKFDCFLSSSPYASACFCSAWHMKEFRKEDILLETGAPRNDVLFQWTEEQKERILARTLGRFYPDYAGEGRKKSIVLYAPTFRQGQNSAEAPPWRPELDLERLRRDLGDQCLFLIRTHYFLPEYKDAERYPGFVFDVSDAEEISDLYLIADILVTDYSSALFDYANLRRPMIFYMYDLEYYRDVSNGFYLDPETELPGPIVRTQDELTRAILRVPDNAGYDDRYRYFNEKFNPWEDGRACERVVHHVFHVG